MTPTLSVDQNGNVTADATDQYFNNSNLSIKKTADANAPGVWRGFWANDFHNPTFPNGMPIPSMDIMNPPAPIVLEDGVSYDVAFNGSLSNGETSFGGSMWSIGATFVKGVSGSQASQNLLAGVSPKGKKKQ